LRQCILLMRICSSVLHGLASSLEHAFWYIVNSFFNDDLHVIAMNAVLI
jgi:hypothetical protein